MRNSSNWRNQNRVLLLCAMLPAKRRHYDATQVCIDCVLETAIMSMLGVCRLTDRTSNFATYGTMKMYGQMAARVNAKTLKVNAARLVLRHPAVSVQQGLWGLSSASDLAPAAVMQSERVGVFMGQPGMSSTDFFNPSKVAPALCAVP